MTIEIKRTHRLPLEDAKSRMTDVAEKLKHKLAVEYRWETDDTLVFQRRGANGRMKVDAKNLEIVVELGAMLRGLESGIRSSIEERLDEALS